MTDIIIETVHSATVITVAEQGPAGPPGAAGLPSGAANLILATPNGTSGDASLRAMVQDDLPTIGTLPLDGIVLSKTKGVGGIKVDTAAPTYPWRDLEGHLGWDESGVNAFTLRSYIGGVREFAGGVGDKVDCRFHIPHDYVPGSDLFIHLHWSHIGTAISGTFAATLEFTYAKGHRQGIFGATKTVTISVPVVNIATTPQYLHCIDEVQLSSLGGSVILLDTDLVEVDALLNVNITLTQIPTISGGTSNEPFVHYCDLHYQSNGSGTKAKSPDFWT